MPPPLKQPIQLDRRQQGIVACALLPVFAVWQLNGFYMTALAQMSVVLFWIVDVCQWVVLPTALAWLLARTASLRPQHYGLSTSGMRLWALALRTSAVFVTAGLAFFVARNLSWRVLGPSATSLQLAGQFPQGLAALVYAAVSAGLVESAFFIGLPWLWYTSVFRRPSPQHFTLGISVVFAVAHWEQGAHTVAAAFVAHLVLCKWFFYWRTLWPVVLGHTLIDLVILA